MTVGAMCSPGPSVGGPGGYRAERTIALWAWGSVQQHDDPDESGKQSRERKPIQPKAIGREHGRQDAKGDARKHEQRRLISASLQLVPDRHGPTSYRVAGEPAPQSTVLTRRLPRSNLPKRRSERQGWTLGTEIQVLGVRGGIADHRRPHRVRPVAWRLACLRAARECVQGYTREAAYSRYVPGAPRSPIPA